MSRTSQPRCLSCRQTLRRGRSLCCQPTIGGAICPVRLYTAGPQTLERLAEAAREERRLGLPVLVSGGRPGEIDESLASMMSTVLQDDFRVAVRWREDRSLNTFENAAFSAEILRRAGVPSALLITPLPGHGASPLVVLRRRLPGDLRPIAPANKPLASASPTTRRVPFRWAPSSRKFQRCSSATARFTSLSAYGGIDTAIAMGKWVWPARSGRKASEFSQTRVQLRRTGYSDFAQFVRMLLLRPSRDLRLDQFRRWRRKSHVGVRALGMGDLNQRLQQVGDTGQAGFLVFPVA